MANDGIIVGIGGDTSGLQQSLSRAITHVGKFAAGLTGLVSVAGTFAGIKGALDLGSEMTDLTNRTGIAIQSLYGLRIAFKDAGVDAEALGPAVNKMQRALASAASGGKEANVLKAMGLDPQSLASMDPGQAFAKIGESIAQLPNSTERSAAAMALFGKNGGSLLQVFMDPNFKNAGNISNAARLLGENAGIFDKASDALGHVPDKLKGLFVGMASGATGFLDTIANGIDGLDLTGVGQRLGALLGNFSTDWKSELKKVEALALQLTALAFSPQLVKPLAAELLIAAREFGKELAANIPGAPVAMEKFQNLVASTTTSMMNGLFYSRSQAQMEERAKNETDPAKKKLYQGEADRLQKLIDQGPSFKNQGIDYNTAGNEQFDKIKKAGDQGIADLLKKISAISDSTGAFKATDATQLANDKARGENANRLKPNEAFDAAAIGGMASRLNVDSLTKIGGGGNSTGGSNPLLTENKRQTNLLQQIRDGVYGRGLMTGGASASLVPA